MNTQEKTRFDLWGQSVESDTATGQFRVAFDGQSKEGARNGFLALNDLYLSLLESPHATLGNRHVQQQPCYEEVYKEFRASGLPVDEFACDVPKFESYLKDTLPKYGSYATNQGGLQGYFPQKALEHWISAEYLRWRPNAKVLDFAAWISPAIAILPSYRPAEFYKHDITLKTDLPQHLVAGMSDAVEAPDEYFDFVMAHCAIDNFEGHYDTAFFREARRILKPGGKVLVTPLHMSARYENIVAIGSKALDVDEGASVVVGPPESLRFGRLYSVAALKKRVTDAVEGLEFRIVHVGGLPIAKYSAVCTNRFMLVGIKR